MTDCPVWLVTYGWSWVTFWATPDPVEKIRKLSWSSKQNNVGIRLIWDPEKTQIEIIIDMLSSDPPFLPTSLWSSACLCAGLSPWTLTPMFASIPTREGEGQEHPEQTGEQHEAWNPLHECVSSASSWEFNVFECLAAQIHSTQYLRDSPQQEVGVVMLVDHVVCAQMRNWLTTDLYFVYLSFSGHELPDH